MNKTRNQSGSAFVIVVIVLSVAIIGALGFVFWNNFAKTNVAKSEPQTYAECIAAEGSKLLETYPEQCVTADGKSFTNTAQVAPTADADLTEVVTNELDGRVMTLHYPNDWTISVDESGNKNDQSEAYVHNTTITSPSGKYKVRFNVMKNGGLGGYCEPGMVTVTKLQSKELPGSSTLRFAEVILHYTFDNNDYYAYKTEIQRTAPDITNIKVGDSGCNFSYAGLFSKASTKMESDQSLATASIYVDGLDIDTKLTDAQITAALQGGEYDTAKRILLTLTDK